MANCQLIYDVIINLQSTGLHVIYVIIILIQLFIASLKEVGADFVQISDYVTMMNALFVLVNHLQATQKQNIGRLKTRLVATK